MATQAAGRPKGRGYDVAEVSDIHQRLGGAQILLNDLERARCGLDEYLAWDRHFIALLESALVRAYDYVEMRERGF